ncbi:MAG: DUF1552 domain-containing protein [Myxococcota bacterium]
MMKSTRRLFLRGVGGAVLGLPALESLGLGRNAFAQTGPEEVPPFAVFFRQANGVAQQQSNRQIGDEPERFFAREFGALTEASMEGRAVGELARHRQNLLVLQGVHYDWYSYGDGHANGALQALTGQGPAEENRGGGSEAGGESLDNRIGRELNPDGRDSMFLYAGRNGGWLGGACISHRGRNARRSAINNPWNAYQAFVGVDGGLSPEAQERLRGRRESVNDLVRGQLQALLSRPELSAADRQRLDLHMSSIRELEVTLSCRMDEEAERAVEGAESFFDSTNGDEALATARLHMDVAAAAIACGWTRSVAIQVGSGNDASTRYRNLDSGEMMENYHYLSHRIFSHGGNGDVIPDSDRLHHFVDVQFAQTFGHLLDRLSAYEMPGGQTLLDHGVAAWYNDNSNGPPHGIKNVPWVLAGSAGGKLRQGEMIDLSPGSNTENHCRLLNTIGTVVGLRTPGMDILNDFGDPNREKGVMSQLLI